MVTLQSSGSSVQFTTIQYQQLLSLLSSQVSNAAELSVDHDDSSPSSPIRTILSALDLGATSHITCSSNNSIPSYFVADSFVTLPNHHKVQLHSVGSVHLSPSLFCTMFYTFPLFMSI